MSRLTKKIDSLKYVPTTEKLVSIEEIIYKLGKLENIEEELGCSLEIIFKGLSKGIIVKTKYGSSHRSVDLGKHYPNKKLEYCFTCEEPAGFGDWDCEEYRRQTEYYDLKDYKKTWWLKGDKK